MSVPIVNYGVLCFVIGILILGMLYSLEEWSVSRRAYSNLTFLFYITGCAVSLIGGALFVAALIDDVVWPRGIDQSMVYVTLLGVGGCASTYVYAKVVDLMYDYHPHKRVFGLYTDN